MTDQPSTRLGDHSIAQHMTISPSCIAAHRTLADAWQQMQQDRVRHLPVLEGGRVVGMLSQRDLALLETKNPALLSDVRIADAMSAEPYIVATTAPLRAVVATMHARKLGAAIIVDQGKVAGVFTTTDALRLLRGILEPSTSTS